jgi:hypothetical protein
MHPDNEGIEEVEDIEESRSQPQLEDISRIAVVSTIVEIG